MPTPDEQQPEQDIDPDKVTIVVNGQSRSDWNRYSIESDFLIPADAWSVSLGIPDGIFPDDIKKGMPVLVKVGEDVVLEGRIDRRQRSVARKQVVLSLNGRDKAGVLMDCTTPIFTAKQLSLEEIVANVVRPLGITKIRIDADSTIQTDKITVEPGEKAWDTLEKAAAARGLWPWFEPDGTLVVGGVDYTQPPAATLIMRFDGEENNLISLDETDSVMGCYSEVTVLGQGHAQGKKGKKDDVAVIDASNPPAGQARSLGRMSETSDDESDDIAYISSSPEVGTHNMKVVVTDPDVPYYRPNIVVCGDIDNQEQLRYRARKIMSDAKLNSFDLTAEVHGHRTSDGILWQPGQRIHVICEPMDIDGIYFLIGRSFLGGRSGGTITQLRLKYDGVFIPDAYVEKKKKRKGKKKSDKVAIIDASNK